MQRQNIRKYLLTLRDFGLVKYEPTERQSAIIYLTERGQAHIPESSGENISLPLLGEVAAGKPIEVVGEIEKYVSYLNDLLDIRKGDFLLKIRGGSMQEAGIYSGDVVAIRPIKNMPNNGEIVLVVLPESQVATLKYWHCQDKIVMLYSANSNFSPMRYGIEEVEVHGRVIGHIGLERPRRRYLDQMLSTSA